MANGENAYNLSRGLTAGVGGFFQGRQMAMQEDEYERRRRMDEERMRRQQELDQQANEEYQYQRGLRPMQEQAMQSGLTAQKQNAQLQQMQIDEKMREIEREGVVETMQLLDAGMPNEAAQVFNSGGQRKTRGFRPHPAKPGVWIGSDEQGREGEINPKTVLRAYGQWKEQAPIELKYGSKLVDGSGRVIANNPRMDAGTEDGGGGALNASATEKKIRESIARGTPRRLAEGEAYGYIQKVQDPTTLSTKWIDLRSNEPVGELSMEGKWSLNPRYIEDEQPSGDMGQLPPPQSAPGRMVSDDSGRVFKSDGQWWYDQEGNPVDAASNPINMKRGLTGHGASGKW